MEGNISVPVAVVFDSAAAAEAEIAGVPAAARAVREAAERGHGGVIVVVRDYWAPSPRVCAEIARLADGLPVSFASAATSGDHLVTGERFLATGVFESGSAPVDWRSVAARRILKATAKPQDGIVSRTINRPISRAISSVLLRWSGIRPAHATALAAFAALAMAVALLADGETGLAVGAVLFQIASILDGVDGEIARATFRATPAGARLDSLIDAATNLAFVAGMSWNVAARGYAWAGFAGLMTVIMVATGLSLLARRRSHGGPIDFDALKRRLSAKPTRFRQWLIWLTMRDFLALAITVLVLVGVAPHALVGFAAVAAGWLVVVVATMSRQAA